MRFRIGRLLRRLGMMVVLAILGLVGTVAVQSPAYAVQPPEGCELFYGYNATAGAGISAYRLWDCVDYTVPFPVSIQRYLSPGVWQTVASGSGYADYACNGMAYNVYRVGTSEFAILCG